MEEASDNVPHDGGGDDRNIEETPTENESTALEQTTEMMATTTIDAAAMNEDEEESEFSPEVKARLQQLRELDNDRNGIMETYLKERAELEQKYSTLCQPLYDQRAAIINGVDKHDESATEGTTSNKGIPLFWAQTMGQMPVMGSLVTNADADCLEHLRDVKCQDDAEGGGFTLSFYFEPNEYFTNKVLTKRYEVPNLLTADEPILKNVVGCKIEWKAGKSLTFRQVTKKQRINSGPNKGKVRTVQKRERQESFFHFFEPPRMPSMKDMDEEQADLLEEAFEQDYDVAQAFRSHIIPKAVLWFTGEALMSDMAEIMNEQGESWPEGNSPFPPPAAGDENPECKQN